MEGQHKPLTDSGNAISILFLRYLRFLLFNPKPINQQRERRRESRKQKLKGGKRELNRRERRERRWKANKCGCPIQAMPYLFYFSVISVSSCSIPNPTAIRQEVPGPLVGLAFAGRGRCRGEKLECQAIDICALSIGGEIEIRRDLVERRQEREVHPSPKMLFGSAQSREAREQA